MPADETPAVPEVKFHFNVPDKALYACRLARKAVRSGARLLMVGPSAQLQRLDSLLWSFSAVDFVPHAWCADNTATARFAPVLLAERAPADAVFDAVLHLGDRVPEGCDAWARVIELVSASDAADREQARMRWRAYRDRGWTIDRHDVQKDPQS
ncbi:MAG: DNA polymerase III subunit chi [Burkholderiaceae bacterium]